MEKRLHSRVSAEPQCKARFQLGGRSYDNITVSNLGTDGCCIQIPARSVEGLGDKTLLAGLQLINPGLPKAAIRGQVAWMHRQDRKGTGFIETGVQFKDAPVDYTRGLVNYLVTVAHARFPDPDGMPEIPD